MDIDPSQVPAAKNLATPAAETGQAAAKPAGTVVIGKVDKLQGDAWVIHDGQKVPAKVGATLVQGDSVETAQGAQISLVFADRTTFVLKDKGLVGLDEFSYDPATKTGKESFLVAQGGFSFVSGDIAKTQPDAARIATPVMSLGIRGTTVAGNVGADGNTSVALLPDPGSNFVGEVAVSALGGSGQTFTLNSAGSGILGATSGGSWSVSANAGAAVTVFAPAPAPPPPNPPVLGPSGGSGGEPGGGGTTTTPDSPPLPPANTGPVNNTPPVTGGTGDVGDKNIGNKGTDDKNIGVGDGDKTVVTVNHDPTTSDVTLSGSTAGSPTIISKSGLLINARDADGHALTIAGTITSDHGTVVDNGDGTVTFTPAAGYAGPATLAYTISDGHGGTVAGHAISMVSLAPNNAPTNSGAVTLTSGAEDTAFTVTATQLLANGADVDGDTLSISGLATANGTVTSLGSGTYSITPNTNFNGTLTLTYDIVDGNGGTVAASATSVLSAVNDAPTNSGPVSLTSGAEDTAFTVTTTQLTANGADVDGDTLSISGLTTANGTVTALGGGTYSITPNANYNGTLTLSYDIVDGQGGTVAATASSVLAAVNDAPTLSSATLGMSGSATAGTATTISIASLLGNVSDVEGDSLTITAVSSDNGTASISGGNIVYTPSTSGALNLTYTVSDGTNSITDHGSITVAVGNAAPVAHMTGTLTYAAAGTHQANVAGVDNYGIAADINGDGLTDILYYNTASGMILGTNSGDSFSSTGFSYTTLTAAGTVNGRYDFGDIDGDGDIDIIKLDNSTDTVSFLYNNGSGSFTASGSSLTSISYLAFAEVANLNNDAYPDLIVLRNTGYGDRVYFGNAGGSFTVGGTLGSAGGKSIGVADLDGDGDNDIVIGNWGAPAQVWINSGSNTGTFTQTGTLSVWDVSTGTTSQGSTLETLIADFNGDGHKDIVLVNRGVENMLYVNDSGGGGTFTLSGGFGSFTGAGEGIRPGGAAADVDNDGDMDVIIATEGNDELWLNSGSGSFTRSSYTLDGDWNDGILAADFDGDGDIDFVDLASHNQATTFYRNTMLSPPTYTEGGAAAGLYTGLALSDADHTSLTSATITIGGYGSGDLLVFTTQNGITGSYGGGALTLSGTATLADYQTAISSVTFQNTGTAMASGDRTLSLTVSDGTTSSSALTQVVQVTIPNDTLTATVGADNLDGGDGSNTYDVAPTTFNSGDSIADSGNDSGNIDTLYISSSGTVDLSAGTVSGVEVMDLAAGGNTVILGGGANPQQFSTINGGAGADVISQANGGGTFDLTGIVLNSVESIATGTGTSSVTFDETSASGVSVLVDGATGDGDSVTFYQTAAGTLDISGKTITNFEGIILDGSTSSGGMVLVGGAQAATIIGGSGNDTLSGGAGADSFTGGLGNDTLVGGAGTDVARFSGNAADYILTFSGGTLGVAAQSGTDGTDRLTDIETLVFSDGSFTVSASGTTLTALGASSTLTVGSGIAEVDFGSGTNTLVTDMATLAAGLSLQGGAGLDTLVISDTGSLGTTQMAALSGVETLTLASTITAAQYVDLGGEADSGGLTVVNASAATGTVNIHGSSRTADLTLTGGAGNDSIAGGSGNDTIAGGGGSNTIDAGAGTDTVSYASQGSGVMASINGTSAAVTHSSGSDTLSNAEIVQGSNHADIFTVASASAGITVDGGGGTDMMDYSAMASGITATVTGTSASVVHAGGTDAISNVEILSGSAYNDTFVGGGGNDTFFGGVGADHMTGGSGADTFVYTAVNQSQDGASVRDVITDFTSGTDHIDISLTGTHVDVSGFEIAGTYNAGQSSLTGGSSRTGGVAGDGFYSSFDHALYIYQGSTNSDIASDGGFVIDSTGTIAAGDLRFNITGTAGNDTLVGGMGDDTLAGGAGANTLTGGSGADSFVLDAGATSTAVITDFNAASDNLTLSSGSFGLNSSGTLTDGVNYGEGTAMDGTARNFGSGTDGIVAIQNGANVDLWHTSNMGAATSANSQLVGTLENVNTSALDNTSFHLAV